MLKNLFAATKQNPYHLSTGVVLLDKKGRVGVHHFKDHPEVLKATGLNDMYILIRETLEGQESLQQAAHRGLAEEFGAKGELVGFLGSRLTSFFIDEVRVQKTVIYFVARLISWNAADRLQDDPEVDSIIEWHEPLFLIARMKQQSKTPLGADIDESEVLERLIASPWSQAKAE